ncbi:stage III sporulation protein AG [Brotaphodocola catenula]|uniref:Stage III sporulation protein AG n=1 Tax=Brotaphodocola catenula TaxID=2885361 RepID=A0AAE3APE4_9FIRM|nr:stage III sporulation protein AG [Brotaphodocola catenula]MCC2163522.1 stage III sporulation protein AG [Brotaphodocola catenula]
MWKSELWKRKDKWLFVLTIGTILCILAISSGKQTGKMQSLPSGDVAKSLFLKSDSSVTSGAGGTGRDTNLAGSPVGATSEDDLTVSSVSSGSVTRTYEQQLETRVKNILKNVDGVGKVDVMIALYSSSEKVIRSDTNSSGSLTEEADSSGGTRRSESSAYSTTTIMEDSNGNSTPVIEKEVYPEISGIVISAEGGDDPKVRSEISTAMEALFGLPAHKIKVLKRAG